MESECFQTSTNICTPCRNICPAPDGTYEGCRLYCPDYYKRLFMPAQETSHMTTEWTTRKMTEPDTGASHDNNRLSALEHQQMVVLVVVSVLIILVLALILALFYIVRSKRHRRKFGKCCKCGENPPNPENIPLEDTGGSPKQNGFSPNEVRGTHVHDISEHQQMHNGLVPALSDGNLAEDRSADMNSDSNGAAQNGVLPEERPLIHSAVMETERPDRLNRTPAAQNQSAENISFPTCATDNNCHETYMNCLSRYGSESGRNTPYNRDYNIRPAYPIVPLASPDTASNSLENISSRNESHNASLACQQSLSNNQCLPQSTINNPQLSQATLGVCYMDYMDSSSNSSTGTQFTLGSMDGSLRSLPGSNSPSHTSLSDLRITMLDGSC